jgi:predicted glycosyltransferase
VFVYVDERERDDCLRTLPFLRPIEAKLRFVGYVGSRRPGPRATGRAEPTAARWRILATFGSGINAGARARLGCEAFVILAAARPGGSLDVVTGGQLPEPVYRQLVERFAAVDAIRFTRFVPSLAARLDGYDLVLAMGGYNACVELYESSARGIVFPRNSPLDHEQGVQALKFKEYGGVDHVVDLGTTTPAALARLMQESLDSPPTPRTPIDVGGAARTVDILLEELARRSHAP